MASPSSSFGPSPADSAESDVESESSLSMDFVEKVITSALFVLFLFYLKNPFRSVMHKPRLVVPTVETVDQAVLGVPMASQALRQPPFPPPSAPPL